MSRPAPHALSMGLSTLLALVSSVGCTPSSSSTEASTGENSKVSSAEATNTSGSSSGGAAAAVMVGSEFRRVCSAESEGITLTTGEVSCTILSDVGRVRVNLDDERASPLLAVTFDGLEPGERTTDDGSMSDVILQGPCPARAQGSPEPCTIELTSLTRGASQASDGEVEEGSSLTLRVACPASLIDDAGDARTSTEQTPRSFEIEAEDCSAY